MPARGQSSAETHTAAAWLDAVKAEERRGELLTAFDVAQHGLAEHPDDLSLKHRAVLALARAGEQLPDVRAARAERRRRART